MQEAFITHLLEIIEGQKKLIGEQKKLIDLQQKQITSLESQIVGLNLRIQELERRKNSGNSNMPPSSDLMKPQRNKSLREKTDRRSGGQAGHPGSTLKMSPTPDNVEQLLPERCEDCGRNLSGIEAEFIERRQVVDIPPVKPIYTEYQTFSKRCCCGCISSGKFPVDVGGRIQYGTHVMTWVAYLSVRQYLPYNRIKECLSHLYGMDISEGTIHNLLQDFAVRCTPLYQDIKSDIEGSTFIGTDETGAKVNGKKNWCWTWQNERSTYLVISPSRGFQTIQHVFPDGLPHAILCHDRWAAHFMCKAKNHQICLAHLERELNYIQELYQHRWATKFKQCLKDALNFRYDLVESGDFKIKTRFHTRIEKRLDELLHWKLPDDHKKAITLQKKLRAIRDHILVFLYYEEVQPDNNGSERAIRNVKIKEKVSGQFRSQQGAQAFAIIRSVIDTAIKRGISCFDALFSIANPVAE